MRKVYGTISLANQNARRYKMDGSCNDENRVVKIREAYYCNVKVFLLFLVILGHGIEPFIGRSEGLLQIYRIIYTFHMPLFALVTGIFLKTKRVCKQQALSGAVWYLVAQGMRMVFVYCTQGKKLSLLKPYWYLWYLLSLCWWAVLCGLMLWLRERGVSAWLLLLVSLASASAAGFCPGIGRRLSLSRTIVFFPYVLAGQMLPVDFFRRLRVFHGIMAVGGFCLLYRLAGDVPAAFFYQAGVYRTADGMMSRWICYGLAFFAGVTVLSLIPARRLCFSRWGADTLLPYLIHGLGLPYMRIAVELTSCALLWGMVYGILVLAAAGEWMRWFGECYGIRSENSKFSILKAGQPQEVTLAR